VALSIEDLAGLVGSALESADLDAYQELLDPAVRWGPPDDPSWGCNNRRQVLSWYKEARDRGVRAKVNEVIPGTDHLLVGMTVSGRDGDDGGSAPRWQVLTVKDGLITDICGFEDRDEAAARAGINLPT
jgi:SnoaL-like domain